MILCGAAYRYNESAFKEYNVLSRRGLSIAIVGVGVWPRLGVIGPGEHINRRLNFVFRRRHANYMQNGNNYPRLVFGIYAR